MRDLFGRAKLISLPFAANLAPTPLGRFIVEPVPIDEQLATLIKSPTLNVADAERLVKYTTTDLQERDRRMCALHCQAGIQFMYAQQMHKAVRYFWSGKLDPRELLAACTRLHPSEFDYQAKVLDMDLDGEMENADFVDSVLVYLEMWREMDRGADKVVRGASSRESAPCTHPSFRT